MGSPTKEVLFYSGTDFKKCEFQRVGIAILSLLQVCLLRGSPGAPRHGRPSRRCVCVCFRAKSRILFHQLLVFAYLNNYDVGFGAGGFSVAFDPLDGSSIVDTNFTVGTIFGVWPGDKLTGVTGAQQVAAAMGIYGPRTTYVLALKDCPGTHEFLLLDEGMDLLRIIVII